MTCEPHIAAIRARTSSCHLGPVLTDWPTGASTAPHLPRVLKRMALLLVPLLVPTTLTTRRTKTEADVPGAVHAVRGSDRHVDFSLVPQATQLLRRFNPSTCLAKKGKNKMATDEWCVANCGDGPQLLCPPELCTCSLLPRPAHEVPPGERRAPAAPADRPDQKEVPGAPAEEKPADNAAVGAELPAPPRTLAPCTPQGVKGRDDDPCQYRGSPDLGPMVGGAELPPLPGPAEGPMPRGDHATQMGQMTEASGDYSTALGAHTLARGKYSTAMGWSSHALRDYTTAFGRDTTASGLYATAMGHGTEAAGDYSTAIGHSTRASGPFSVAMGANTRAAWGYATAMGANTSAIGEASTAMGHNTCGLPLTLAPTQSPIPTTRTAAFARQRGKAQSQQPLSLSLAGRPRASTPCLLEGTLVRAARPPPPSADTPSRRLRPPPRC